MGNLRFDYYIVNERSRVPVTAVIRWATEAFYEKPQTREFLESTNQKVF